MGVLYRPPNTNLKDFIVYFTDILIRVKQEENLCYLMGDTKYKNIINIDTHIQTTENPNSQRSELTQVCIHVEVPPSG